MYRQPMSDEGDVNLGIKVTSTADTSGLREAQEGASGLKGTLGETATELRHLTGSSREGQEIFRGLGAAASGGARGVGEMVRGLRSLSLIAAHLIGSGPLGVLLILAGLVAGAFLEMAGRGHEAADATDQVGRAAEEAAKRMEAIKRAVDESFQPLEEELKLINEQFSALKQRMSEAESEAKELERSQIALAESQLSLNEAKELEGAGGDETKRAYIEKEYAARRELIKAQQEQNEAGQGLLDAIVKLGAAEDEAGKKAAVAAEGQQKLADAKADLAEKTDAARRASEFYEQALVKENQATAKAQAQAAAADKLSYDNGAGHLGANAVDALPESIDAKLAKAQADEYNKQRIQTLKDAQESASRVKDIEAKQQPIDDQAAKAADVLQSAQLKVDREKEVAANESATATNKVAEAIVKGRDVDRATVNTSKPPVEKEGDEESSAEARAAAKAASAEVREQKSQARAEAKSEKAKEEGEKEAEKSEAKTKSEVDKSEDKEDKAAAHALAQHQKEILEELKKHTAALHHIASNTGPKKEKERGPSHVAIHAAVRGERTERQARNALADTSP